MQNKFRSGALDLILNTAQTLWHNHSRHLVIAIFLYVYVILFLYFCVTLVIKRLLMV